MIEYIKMLSDNLLMIMSRSAINVFKDKKDYRYYTFVNRFDCFITNIPNSDFCYKDRVQGTSAL